MLYAALGAAVLALAVVDVVKTTVSAAGGGPVSRRLSHLVWEATGRRPLAGPTALMATAVVWVALFWGGWSLVFLADAEAVVSASGGEPATVGERLYFAGYTVLTLGTGDFVPSTDGWRALTVVASAMGLVFITLGVTYYTAVLSAVVHKRRLASLVAALGRSPADIVVGAWDGGSFEGTGSVLTTLADRLAEHDRQHEAYPVLHFFAVREAERAAAVQIARLGEALDVWAVAVASENRPPPGPLRAARRALRRLLDTLEGDFITAAAEPPPAPDLAPLHAAGVPLAESTGPLSTERRRRLLLGLVEGSGFSWADVSGLSSPPSP